MIGKLSGIIDDVSDDHVVVDVNGVGYLVYSAEILSFQIGSNVKLYVETHVKEDAINLYGFTTLAHKQSFISLTTVNGIGPKAALNILSKLSPQDLQQAIVSKNTFAFKQVSGVGTKLAERIILELQNKPLFKASISIEDHKATKNQTFGAKNHDIFNDAVMGLINLGITYTEASMLVHSVIADSQDISDAISNALKLRGSRHK